MLPPRMSRKHARAFVQFDSHHERSASFVDGRRSKNQAEHKVLTLQG